MELKDQVCSLELAKKLKELGVKQESLFYWVNQVAMKGAETIWFPDDPKELKPYKHYSAFTVAELGELLPKKTGYKKVNDLWIARHSSDRNTHFDDKTEANARAKCLIHLIEKGVINGTTKP